MSDDLYPIPAKPVTYKGIAMRSKTEARVAGALERIGLEVDPLHYERLRFADETGFYTPDFGPYEVAALGVPEQERVRLFVEARPEQTSPGHRRLAEQNAATLAMSEPDALLVFVGWREYGAALVGWCFGALHRRVHAVIGVRRDAESGFQEPCLYVGDFAHAWADGLLTHET